MKTKIVLLILFISSAAILSAESWVINRISIEIEGTTRESALRDFIQLNEEDRFDSLFELETKMHKVQEELLNNRIFEENAEVTWDVVQTQGDVYRVNVWIKLDDSWNIIVLPYGKFDSNTGLELSIKIRDYNFLGYMNRLSMDIEYSAEDESVGVNLKLPVNQLEFEFDYSLDNENGDLENNFFWGSAYTWKIPVMDHEFNLKASEGFYYKPSDEDEVFYMDSTLEFYTLWDLPWTVYDDYQPVYKSGVSAEIAYLPSFREVISEDRDGLELGYDHSLSLGGTNWNGNNYKEGAVFVLSNSYSYLIDSDMFIYDRWSGDVSARVEVYRDWYPWATSLRFTADHDIFRSQSMGQYFRGILTDDIESRGGFIMNSALYLTVWNWDPVWEWHGGPTLDIGYLYGVPDGEENLIYAVGLEGLAFPYVMRSLYARFSIGIDGNGFMDSTRDGFSRIRSNWELFFGLGSFY